MADDNDGGWYRANREKERLEKELAWVNEALKRVANIGSGEAEMGLHPGVSHHYPNLEAIVHGTISGIFRDWPHVRPELIKLFKEVKQSRVEIGRSMEVRKSLRAELDHSRAGAMEERRRMGANNDRLEAQVEAANRNSRDWAKRANDLEKDNAVLRQGVKFVDPTALELPKVVDCKCVKGAYICDAHVAVSRSEGLSSEAKRPLDPE